jgi:hypothetical protein
MPVGFPVPVLGVFQIALLNMQDAVQPSSERRVIVLHEVVRLVPLPGAQVHEDLPKTGLVGGAHVVQASSPQTGGVPLPAGVSAPRNCSCNQACHACGRPR